MGSAREIRDLYRASRQTLPGHQCVAKWQTRGDRCSSGIQIKFAQLVNDIATLLLMSQARAAHRAGGGTGLLPQCKVHICFLTVKEGQHSLQGLQVCTD